MPLTLLDDSVTEGMGTICPCLVGLRMLTWQHKVKLEKPEGVSPFLFNLVISLSEVLQNHMSLCPWNKDSRIIVRLKKSNYGSLERNKPTQKLSGFRNNNLFQLSYKSKWGKKKKTKILSLLRIQKQES